jgi:hypothetical protein
MLSRREADRVVSGGDANMMHSSVVAVRTEILDNQRSGSQAIEESSRRGEVRATPRPGLDLDGFLRQPTGVPARRRALRLPPSR